MNIVNGNDDSINFLTRFYKLGFDKSKMKLANFDREKITRRLNEISLIESGNIKLPEKKLSEIIQETKRILYDILNNVSLKVNKFDNEFDQNMTKNKAILYKYYHELMEEFKKGELNDSLFGELLLLKYEELSTKESVFNIPVTEDKELDSMKGGALKGPVLASTNIDILKKTPVYSEEIFLGTKSPNILSIGTYTHEIMHHLIDRHKASVENYYNDEFIPIFMEKVAIEKADKSPDKKAVKASEIHRLYHVRSLLNKLITDDKNDYETFDRYKYIQSSLYAGILYDKYSKSTKEEKNKIMLYIKNILSGNIKVNDLIEAYELTLDGPEVDEYIDKVDSYTKCFSDDIIKNKEEK